MPKFNSKGYVPVFKGKQYQHRKLLIPTFEFSQNFTRNQECCLHYSNVIELSSHGFACVPDYCNFCSISFSPCPLATHSFCII